jgi:acyl dehydratase
MSKQQSPGVMGSYAKAGLAALPLLGKLPFLPGGGGPLPATTRNLTAATLPATEIVKLRKLTDDRGGPDMPLLLPHFIGFPLHMQGMTDGSFPYPAIGTVHLDNLVERRKVVSSAEPLDIAVRFVGPYPHKKGATFQIETTASSDGEQIWRELSTMLRIGAKAPKDAAELPVLEVATAAEAPESAAVAEWSLPADLGRHWGQASGDMNPIHLSAVSAKAFGFPRAIAHGMWTAARIAAQLQDDLPEAVSFAVSFQKPVLLPAKIALRSWTDGTSTNLLVTSAAGDQIHARGRVSPL